MPLTRRAFSLAPAAAGLAGWLGTPPAAAQATAPVEGVHYLRLDEPVPVAVPGKIEVIEFFWYECPHCNAFEPSLEAWLTKLPDDVAFRRVPVWFREEPFGPQQRIFYALESLGLVATLHAKVFRAIHQDRARLRTPEDIATFALNNGVDPVKFMTAYNSFSAQSKSQQARRTATSYRIDGVPAMGVNGRYTTNGNMANGFTSGGSNDRMLAVVDVLVAKARQSART